MIELFSIFSPIQLIALVTSQRLGNPSGDGGHVIVASFAPDGPTECSGLDVMRYSPDTMHAQFGEGFRLMDSVREEHHTPSGTTQAFVYCLCRVSG